MARLLFVFSFFFASGDAVADVSLFFFFNDTATTEIYTLSLHDALPIFMFLLATLFASYPFLPTAGALAQSINPLSSSSPTNLASMVEPFTGTGVQQGAPYGGGDTFRGADVPFGMVQWSPDTVNYVPGGYWYNDNRLRGFSLTHLNGAGCGVYSDIPFMPYVGTVTRSPATNPMLYISTFSHANESAAAGYYQVKLNNGVNTELTATQRSGAGRFTHPLGKTAAISAT